MSVTKRMEECNTSSICANSDEKMKNSIQFKCGCTHSSIASYDQLTWQELRSSKKLVAIDPNSLNYDKFFHKYLLNNVPCLFSKSITSSWLSSKLWTVQIDEHAQGLDDCHELTNNEKAMIDFDYLSKTYGNATVSAVNCNDVEYKNGYGAKDCRDMLFQKFLQYWQGVTDGEESSAKNSECLYLKDWHIVRFHKNSLPDTSLPYETPNFFESDWLNEVCEVNDADDFKFCYMGPRGSFTGFHADVYGSYSWSANVFGVKRWHLYPPGKESRFVDARTNKLRFDWNEPGIAGEDFIEVIQEAGQCLFVPSGWHHVVWNLTDAISINHNWFNGTNLCYIWRVLQGALKEVQKELDDLRNIPEFHDQCQLILKANHGMNYQDFFELLETIKNARESKGGDADVYANFDMQAIHHVVQEHCSEDAIVKVHYSKSVSDLLKNTPR